MDKFLSIGLSALLSAQKSLDVAGHNIANSTTPNYSRQRVDLVSVPPGSIGPLATGDGVSIERISAIRDGLIDQMLLTQDPLAGGATRRADYLREVESLFSTDPETGLGALIDAFFNSFHELSRNPSGGAERHAVLTEARTMAAGFANTADLLSQARSSLFPHAQEIASRVNSLAERIAQLNLSIRDGVVSGGQPHDLIDQRYTALRELAELIPVSITEDSLQRVDVRCGGVLLVANDDVTPLTVGLDGQRIVAHIGSTPVPEGRQYGQLGAILELANSTIPDYASRLDTLAATLVKEVNKRHSTGIGRNGSFSSLFANRALDDPDLPLNQANLPFDLEPGSLYVSVIEEATGQVTQSRIDFNPYSDSLSDLAAAISAVPHLQASASGGVLHIGAENGYRFDFTNKVPTNPGTLGTAVATLEGNVTLDENTTYTFTVDTSQTAAGPGASAVVGSQTLIGDLAADPGNTYAGTATSSGDYTGTENKTYLIEIVDPGDLSTATYRISEDGGLTWGSTLAFGGSGTIDVFDDVNGTDLGVDATFEDGTFAAGDRFTIDAYAPMENLRLVVTDGNGATVASLEIGDGYLAGEAFDLPGGFRLRLAQGVVSDGDSFSVELAAEPDEAGLLAALGLNTLLRGTTAATISLEETVADNPDLIAASRTATSGDNTNALRLAALADEALADLGEVAPSTYYSQLLGAVGSDSQLAQRAARSSGLMREAAEAQREAVSGVNADEEAIRLMQHQQLYMFAARYLRTIDELTRLLMAI